MARKKKILGIVAGEPLQKIAQTAPNNATSLTASARRNAWHSGPHSRVLVTGREDGNPIRWPTTITIGEATATTTIPAPITEPMYRWHHPRLSVDWFSWGIVAHFMLFTVPPFPIGELERSDVFPVTAVAASPQPSSYKKRKRQISLVPTFHVFILSNRRCVTAIINHEDLHIQHKHIMQSNAGLDKTRLGTTKALTQLIFTNYSFFESNVSNDQMKLYEANGRFLGQAWSAYCPDSGNLL